MRTSTRCDTSAVCLLAAAALLTLALVELPRAQAAPAALRRAELPVRGHYIVRVRSGADPDALANMTQALGRGRVRHVYRQAFRGFAIEASEPAALALASDPAVGYVEEDAVVRATGEQSLQEGDSWGLDRIDQRALTSGATGGYDHVYRYAAEGDGVNVYVVDTGVRTTHEEFAGRAVEAVDARTSEGIAGDCNGHGTHVAAVVGGTRFGVAKQVAIHSVRVSGCDGRGSVSDLLAAIDWITTNHVRPAVINMSLEGGASDAFNESARAAVTPASPSWLRRGMAERTRAAAWSAACRNSSWPAPPTRETHDCLPRTTAGAWTCSRPAQTSRRRLRAAIAIAPC